MTTVPALPPCEVCGGPGYAISALPGIPMSCCRCGNCQAAGAVPYPVLVANIAMVGGMADAADWWCEVIAATLPVARMTLVRFRSDVAETIAAWTPDPQALSDLEPPSDPTRTDPPPALEEPRS